jgi:DNA-binding transcriptional LysR family regulator
MMVHSTAHCRRFEEGDILQAARKLHRVQSSVTTRIKQLETSIGTQLFLRDRQRLVLSLNGESLLNLR